MEPGGRTARFFFEKERIIEAFSIVAGRAAFAAAAMLFCSGAGAQAPMHGPPGASATRSVAKYLDLETALHKALAAGDSKAVDALLDTDFEVRSPNSADTQPRDAWFAATLRKEPAAARVRDLSVYESDDLAVVSFLLEQPGAKSGKGKTPTWFIVDIWRQSSGKLQMRHVSMPANAPPFRERPDGRQ
jgi:hypothetical protein